MIVCRRALFFEKREQMGESVRLKGVNLLERSVKRLMQEAKNAQQARVLRRAQRGDPDAFEQLAAPYEKHVYALCLRMLACREDAQDAAQETMIRLYHSLGEYRGDAQLSTFIYRIATNVCLDALRRRKVRAGESLDALGEAGYTPPDRQPGPEERLLRKERGEALSQAIDSLSEEMRMPLVLRELHDLSYEEVANALGVGMGTVKSRIHRAREKLARLLRDDPAFAGAQSGKGGRGA